MTKQKQELAGEHYFGEISEIVAESLKGRFFRYRGGYDLYKIEYVQMPDMGLDEMSLTVYNLVLEDRKVMPYDDFHMLEFVDQNSESFARALKKLRNVGK